MTCLLWLLYRVLNLSLLASCILSLTLSSTQAAYAKYQPPRTQKPPSTYTDSSGVRGSCQTTGVSSPILLAPMTHVGQTTSTHPTFAWFVPYDQKIPIEFTLYEFDTNDQPTTLTYKYQLQSSPGIMKLSLPQYKQGLTSGKKYLWQVETLCNPNRPSRNFLVRAEIEVVQMPSTLKILLSREREPSERANSYAEAGMWYDALGEALAFTVDGQLTIVGITLIQDLAQLEKSLQNLDLYNLALSN